MLLLKFWSFQVFWRRQGDPSRISAVLPNWRNQELVAALVPLALASRRPGAHQGPDPDRPNFPKPGIMFRDV